MNESRPQIEYCWPNENYNIVYFNSDEQAPSIKERIVRVGQNLPVNMIFVIDKSESMEYSRYLHTLLNQGPQAASNIIQSHSTIRRQKMEAMKSSRRAPTIEEVDTNLLDVFDAILLCLTNRTASQPVISKQDRYGCILFDDSVRKVQPLG